MSKGIGALQRRLLATIEVAEPPMMPVLALIARELEGLSLAEKLTKIRSIDAAVRRALRGLERRGHLVNVGRAATGMSERPTSYYATPAGAAEMRTSVAHYHEVVRRRPPP
jgi:hypothetical protein